MELRLLQDIIADQMAVKEVSTERLCSLTGVSETVLSALLSGQREQLPALPYVRSALIKIANVLELDREVLLSAYRNEYANKMSGVLDLLPGNRFALHPATSRKWIFVSIAVILAVIFLIFGQQIFGKPSLRLTVPDPDQNPYIAATSTITLSGKIDAGDKLVINGEDVATDDQGFFTLEYRLNPELNTIEFLVRRFLGKEITVLKQVYLQPTE